MPPDMLFDLANTAALAGWAVLLLAPRRLTWLAALPRTAIPLALAALYTALVAAHFAGTGGGYGSIAAVRTLFASDPVLVAGWVHYLSFDLLIGCLLADRMDRAGLHRLLQAPVLLATFLFGPVGLLLALLAEGALRLWPGRPAAEA